jgi:Domain of unknown function (DUF4111)
VLAELPRAAIEDLLARLDRSVPGRIQGLYVVGSASMGAFRPGRSDVDFVAIVAGDLRPSELLRLRAVHQGRWISALIRDVALRRQWPLVCNGIYLKAGDLSLLPREVTPLCGQVAGRFRTAERDGFDVNPVTWYVLAHHGIAVRGPDRDRLRIHTDEAELRTWAVSNLNGYWRRWALRAGRGTWRTRVIPTRRFVAEGVLGAPRLHYTIATGKIATKERAARYALEIFDARWHRLIEDAMAYWRGDPPSARYGRHPTRQQREAADFVAYVIEATNNSLGSMVEALPADSDVFWSS